jgi:hypothetical protein
MIEYNYLKSNFNSTTIQHQTGFFESINRISTVCFYLSKSSRINPLRQFIVEIIGPFNLESTKESMERNIDLPTINAIFEEFLFQEADIFLSEQIKSLSDKDFTNGL